MIIIGITGIIGSGKTTTSNTLRKKGLRVIDLDAIAKKAVLLEDVQQEIAHKLGPEYIEDGKLSTSRLQQTVFSNKDKLQVLEGIIHPRVIGTLAAEIEAAKQDGVKSVLIDAPLLFETDLHTKVDKIIVVSTTMERVRQRLKQRGHTDEDIANRILNQIPLSEKEKRADVVLFNNGTREDLERDAEGLLRRIKEWEVVDAS